MTAMTATRRLSRMAAHVPIGSQLGFAVLVLGLAADVLAHLDPALDPGHGAIAGTQLSAHLVVFIGMALVLVGVVVDGVRSGRRHETRREGSALDAVR